MGSGSSGYGIGRGRGGTSGSRDDGFRTVHGFTTRLHEGNQGKHIPGHNNYDPKAGEITVRAGKPRANEHEQLRRGLDIKDTTVTFRITAGKQRGQEFKVRLGQSFRVPGCDTGCVLREINEQQDSVTLSIDGLESPVNVPRVDGESS